PGSRNGYREVSVKTTAGPVGLARPKLRGTSEAFASRLFGAHVTKTNALESLVIASFVRGLPVRDVEATLADALGDQAAVSKSTVSAICQAIKDEYEAWSRRRLDEVSLDYLFLDASFFRMHPGSPAEPVLASWGMAVCGLLLGWRGSTRQLSALGCLSSKQGRPRSLRAGTGVRAGGVRATRIWIRSWSRRCWRWLSRMSAVIRSRRCGGRPS